VNDYCEPDEHMFTRSGKCIACDACKDASGIYVPQN
jgi:hypothetical protein